tara:strand:- start:585 stop:803 length:219 start_codon:yes stop_codon:yes gene_type:complete
VFKIDTVKEPNFHMHKLTFFYIFALGAGVQIIHSEDYISHRYMAFIKILGLNLAFEILGGSDYDIHITLRLF